LIGLAELTEIALDILDVRFVKGSRLILSPGLDSEMTLLNG